MLTAVLCPLLLVLAPTAPDPADELLSDAVGQQQTNPDQVDVAEMLREERKAEIELALGAIRLGLLKAKARCAQGAYAEALELASAARSAVDRLPAGVERAPLIEPLDELIAKIRAARATDASKEGAEGSTAFEARIRDERGNGFDEASAGATSPRAERHFPDRKEFPLDRASGLDHRFDAYLVATLERMGEDPHITTRFLSFPKNWHALTQRRAKYKEGIIYEAPQVRGADGELKQTIIYDVQSLLLGTGPRFPFGPYCYQPLMSPAYFGRPIGLHWYGTGLYSAAAYDPITGVPTLRFIRPPELPKPVTPEEEARERWAQLTELVEQVLEAE